MLEKCKEYGPLFVDNVDSNKTLLTMLRMLTESFRLGFLYAR